MAEVLSNSLEGFVRERCVLHNAPYEKLETTEFLFGVSEEIIKAAGPKNETLKFPYLGKTPFYQGKHSELMIADRLTTDKIAVFPYHDVDYNDEDCYDPATYIPDEFTEGEVSLELAVDLRSQYKRNKLPVPLAFGRLALSSNVYKDKVLRVIESDKNKLGSSPLNSNHNLLISNLDIYGLAPECRARDAEIINMAKRVEEISRILGVHDLVTEVVEARQA